MKAKSIFLKVILDQYQIILMFMHIYESKKYVFNVILDQFIRLFQYVYAHT